MSEWEKYRKMYQADQAVWKNPENHLCLLRVLITFTFPGPRLWKKLPNDIKDKAFPKSFTKIYWKTCNVISFFIFR